MAKLDVKKLGLALGFTCAICCFFIALTAWLWGWGTAIVDLIGTVYIGYEATGVGALIGIVYGFIDGFIGGVLIAWFYNKF
ncbi:bacteriophage holin [Nanoarchaeota archaeon]